MFRYVPALASRSFDLGGLFDRGLACQSDLQFLFGFGNFTLPQERFP
jgi:hypothetical protein